MMWKIDLGSSGRMALVIAVVLAACVESASFTPIAPTVPAPRLPMNDAYVGSVHTQKGLAPRFVWEASTAGSSGEIRYQLQYGTDAEFARDVITVETVETSHQVAAALPVALTPPVGARYYWRVRACLRNACSEYSRRWWVNLGRVIKDYNGDGYSDVAVGASGNDGICLDCGRVFVHFGGPGRGIDGTPDAYVGGSGVQGTGYPLGYAVTYAGDVNGDGFGDLLVGNQGEPETAREKGGAYVYLGGEPFNNVVDLSLQTGVLGDGFGYRVRALGDLNADGYSDFAVLGPPSGTRKAHVYQGNGGARFTRVELGALEWTGFLSDFAGAGDVNGDGFADLVLGNAGPLAPPNSGTGQARLYYGGEQVVLSREPDAVIPGAFDGDLFGASVSGADVTCDGFSEVIVANERSEDTGFKLPGRVDVFRGGVDFDATADFSFSGQVDYDAFGRSLAVGGDYNGDGCGDLAVGAVLTRENGMGRGRGYVYFGGSALDATPEAVLYAPPTAFNAFNHVRALGDVNGDGYDDLGAGDHAFGPSGAVDVYLGGEGATFDATFDTRLTGAAANDYYGISL